MKKYWILLAASLFPAGAAKTAEERFRPEVSFPAESVVYFSVGSIREVEEGLRTTLLGRIGSHPGFRAALGRLPEMLLARYAQAKEEYPATPGMHFLEALRLSRGEVAAAVAGVGEDHTRLALAVELGAERQAVLDLLGRIDKSLGATEGGAEFSREPGDPPVMLWPPVAGASRVARAVLGTHLVFAIPAESLAPIIRAHRGGGEKKPLRDAAFLTGLTERLRLGGDREALLAIDLAGIRAALRRGQAENPEPPDDANRLLRASGLEAANALGMAVGFRDGGLEFKCHLSSPGGLKGLLAVLAGSLSPLERPEEYLERVPAEASGLLALRLQPGKLLFESLNAISAEAPEIAASLRQNLGQLEQMLGISLKEDLKDLPPVGMLQFGVTPPAGSLVEDQICLLRTAEFRPYQEAIVRALETSGRGLRAFEEDGRKLFYFPLGAFVDLGDGWTAYSGTLVALRRYAPRYAGLKKDARAPETMAFFRERISGAPAAAVLRGARSFLGLYNTVVSIANLVAPTFEAQLEPLGVDPGLLPAGEEFLSEVKDGSLRFEIGPEGLTLHGHRVVRNTGWLTLVAGTSIAAGVSIPTLISAREKADVVRCQLNLRELYQLALLEAEKSGRFPSSPQGGAQAAEALAAASPVPRPELLRCPATGLVPGYELVPWKLARDAPGDALLAFDRGPFHHGKRNVVHVDGSVELLLEAVFQGRLESDRKRFAKEK